MLEVKNLEFGFDGKKVLKNINLTVDKGQLLCLLGPNGCGKTSLLNCMTSYYSNYGGDITLDGRSVRSMNLKARAKVMSYVPQLDKAFFPYSVFEIVLMGRTPHTGYFSMPSKADEEIVKLVLEKMEIGYLSHRIFNTLSGGEAQLVKLARGLAQKARLHLLDEPTSALDLHHELKLLQTIAGMVTHYESGVVMATHYPNQPMYFEGKGISVRACLMKNGEICHEGRPSEIITPETLRDIYGVDAHIMDFQDEEGGRRHVVIPLRT